MLWWRAEDRGIGSVTRRSVATEMQAQQQRLLLGAFRQQAYGNELTPRSKSVTTVVKYPLFATPSQIYFRVGRRNHYCFTCCPVCTRLHGISFPQYRQCQLFSSKVGSDSAERQSCNTVTTNSRCSTQNDGECAREAGTAGGASESAEITFVSEGASNLAPTNKADLNALRYPKLADAASRAASRIESELAAEAAARALTRASQQPIKPSLPPSSGTVLTWRVALLGSAVAMYGQCTSISSEFATA